MHRALRHQLPLLCSLGLAVFAAGCELQSAPIADETDSVSSTSSALSQVGNFAATGALGGGHSLHTETRLKDGRVLIIGGSANAVLANGNIPGVSNTAELYDPGQGTFRRTGNPGTPRAIHRATLLDDGRVLITGGYSGSATLNTAELYQPLTGTFTSTDTPMAVVRRAHSATLLSNGLVLIAGGHDGTTTYPSTAELYNPQTGRFLPAERLGVARQYLSATRLQDGRVLLAGGYGVLPGTTSQVALNTAELYDPATGRFTATGALNIARYLHQATLLPSGRVLITGGNLSTNGNSTPIVELYDPAGDNGRGSFSVVAPMTAPRQNHTATLLTSGRVLVTGGAMSFTAQAALNSAEIYDPTSGPIDPASSRPIGQWTSTGTMVFARQRHTATSLGGELVLVAGGHSTTTTNALTAEIFSVPSAPGPVNDGGIDLPMVLDARVPDLAVSCVSGSFLRCQGSGAGSVRVSCNTTGDGELFLPCPSGCNSATQRCNSCVPRARRCLGDGQVSACSADGSGETASTCPADTDPNTLETCVPALGDCRSVLLVPATCGVGMTCVPCGGIGQVCCGTAQCNDQAVCDGGRCVANCDDGNACTVDTVVTSGGSASCQHTPVAAGTVCRAAVGGCDAAEVCNGTGAACPADGLALVGTVCRAAAGSCDVAETCNGTSSACPSDGFSPGSTVCRPAAGVCDVAESCTGLSGACPADGYLASGTLCRPATGACDVPEVCNGGSASCPGDARVSAGTICNATIVGPCDAVDRCNGTSTACPVEFVPAGTVCRTLVGSCDVTEACTGGSTACPADSFVSVGTACPSPGGPYVCSGGNGSCPSSCQNNSNCASNNYCVGGQCTAGVCTPGQTRTAACGNCGTQTDTCSSTGQWQVGACSNQGACVPGATRAVGCGNCGTETDTCSASCQWQAGTCTNQGACGPGATRTVGCGLCGTETDTCSASCQWQAGSCTNQGVCAPGATRSAGGCGNCGSLIQTCTGSCQWNGGSCQGQGACSPGSTRSCGTCGTESCSTSCQWSGVCNTPGACCPGQTRDAGSCGNCGRLIQTCSAAYQWDSGSCQGQGVCSPGQTEAIASCDACGYTMNVCSSACQWQGSGCLPAPRGSGCGYYFDECIARTCDGAGTTLANCNIRDCFIPEGQECTARGPGIPTQIGICYQCSCYPNDPR